MPLKLLKSNKDHDFVDNLTKILFKNQKIIVSCVFQKLLEGRIEPSRGPHAARGPRV
jgi:hypothetical protein